MNKRRGHDIISMQIAPLTSHNAVATVTLEDGSDALFNINKEVMVGVSC